MTAKRYTVPATSIVRSALVAYERDRNTDKTVRIFHQGLQEKLREFMKRWCTQCNVQPGSLPQSALNDYVAVQFSAASRSLDFKRRNDALEDLYPNTNGLEGRLKNFLADHVLKNNDPFVENYIDKWIVVTFRSQGASFSGSIRISRGVFDDALRYKMDASLQQHVVSRDLNFIAAGGRNARGLKLKHKGYVNEHVDFKFHKSWRAIGAPTGTFGQDGYKIDFKTFDRAH